MRIVVALLMFLSVPTAGLACGNPLLWAILFARIPEAKIVYDAELAGRADGLITARVYEAKPGQPYHKWSKAWILDLAREMRPTVTGTLAPGEDFTVLLADEVAAIRFSHRDGVEFIPASTLQYVEHYDLITSINALKGVWRDGLSYQEMIDRDLALVGGGETETVAVARVFEMK